MTPDLRELLPDQGATDRQLLTELINWCRGHENAMQGLKRGYIAERLEAIRDALAQPGVVEHKTDAERALGEVYRWHDTDGDSLSNLLNVLEAWRPKLAYLVGVGFAAAPPAGEEKK